MLQKQLMRSPMALPEQRSVEQLRSVQRRESMGQRVRSQEQPADPALLMPAQAMQRAQQQKLPLQQLARAAMAKAELAENRRLHGC